MQFWQKDPLLDARPNRNCEIDKYLHFVIDWLRLTFAFKMPTFADFLIWQEQRETATGTASVSQFFCSTNRQWPRISAVNGLLLGDDSLQKTARTASNVLRCDIAAGCRQVMTVSRAVGLRLAWSLPDEQLDAKSKMAIRHRRHGNLSRNGQGRGSRIAWQA